MHCDRHVTMVCGKDIKSFYIFCYFNFLFCSSRLKKIKDNSPMLWYNKHIRALKRAARQWRATGRKQN